MRVLITGSSGQIGSNLALRCLAREDEVIGIDNRENSWTEHIDTVIWDLRTSFAEQHFFAQGPPDVVVHLAANAKVHELVIDPARALDNITITFNVLEYCRAHHVPIIFSSSREVYGDVYRESTAEEAADYSQVTSAYTASKLSGEALIFSYHKCYHLPYIVFRLSNVYGRFDNDLARMERVIPLFIERIDNEQPITVFGDAKVLDFTYIDDCVAGILSGIEQLHAGRIEHAVMNLAYGQGHSLVSLAQYIGQALEKVPNLQIQPAQVGEITRYVANISRARNLLGYAPKTALPEGIKQVIADRKQRLTSKAV